MTTPIPTLLAWALLVLATPAGAAEPAEPGLVERIEARYAAADTLQASFEQTGGAVGASGKPQVGRLVVQRPDKVRWEFTSPVAQVYLNDGEHLWVYTPGESQVVRYPALAASSGSTSLFQSLDRLDEEFQVEVLEPGSDGGHRLRLRPEVEEQFKHVVLVVDEDLSIREVLVTDIFDQVTEIAFSEVVLGEEVPEGTFVLDLPEGVEVVDGSGG